MYSVCEEYKTKFEARRRIACPRHAQTRELRAKHVMRINKIIYFSMLKLLKNICIQQREKIRFSFFSDCDYPLNFLQIILSNFINLLTLAKNFCEFSRFFLEFSIKKCQWKWKRDVNLDPVGRWLVMNKFKIGLYPISRQHSFGTYPISVMFAHLYNAESKSNPLSLTQNLDLVSLQVHIPHMRT